MKQTVFMQTFFLIAELFPKEFYLEDIDWRSKTKNAFQAKEYALFVINFKLHYSP